MTTSSVGPAAEPVRPRDAIVLTASRLVVALLLTTALFLVFAGRDDPAVGGGLARLCAVGLPLAVAVTAMLHRKVPSGARFSWLAATWMVAGVLVCSVLWLLPGVQLVPRHTWATVLAAVLTAAPVLLWAVAG